MQPAAPIPANAPTGADRPLHTLIPDTVEYYPTVESFRAATGQEPPRDSQARTKHWRSRLALDPGAPRRLPFWFLDPQGADKDGFLKLIPDVLDTAEAAALNYLPAGTSTGITPTSPLPIDPNKLGPNDRIVATPQGPMVRDMVAWERLKRQGTLEGRILDKLDEMHADILKALAR